MFRLVPIIWLAFVIWVVYTIWQEPMTQETKLLWTGVVIFFPGVGIIMWLIYGRTKY